MSNLVYKMILLKLFNNYLNLFLPSQNKISKSKYIFDSRVTTVELQLSANFIFFDVTPDVTTFLSSYYY